MTAQRKMCHVTSQPRALAMPAAILDSLRHCPLSPALGRSLRIHPLCRHVARPTAQSPIANLIVASDVRKTGVVVCARAIREVASQRSREDKMAEHPNV